MKQRSHPFGSGTQAFFYAFLVVAAMWLMYWAEHLFRFDFYTLGVLPRSLEGLKGILFMPLIHSETDFHHILNNSVPTFFLLTALVYFYKEIALKVFLSGWILTGIMLWIYAENKGSYHIGMSGLVYLLAGFLFVSGVLRKFLPLQAISLFVVFLYGSMIWGIFPMEEKISWEGHLMGLIIGVFLAFWFKKNGPQRPKFQYEIEKDLGIEPPDLEGMWNERQRIARELEEERQRQEKGYVIVYHYVPSTREEKPKDETQL